MRSGGQESGGSCCLIAEKSSSSFGLGDFSSSRQGRRVPGGSAAQQSQSFSCARAAIRSVLSIRMSMSPCGRTVWPTKASIA